MSEHAGDRPDHDRGDRPAEDRGDRPAEDRGDRHEEDRTGSGLPWWLGLAPAQAIVSCQGSEHRLRWQDGRLSALDHEDLASERTLAALGGRRCTCVEVCDAWAAHAEDPRVLVLASRGPLDPLSSQAQAAQIGWTQPTQRAGTPSGAGWVTYGPRRTGSFAPMRLLPASPRATLVGRAHRGRPHTAPPATRRPRGERSELTREEELIGLLGLGGGLPERLAATVAAGFGERLARGEEAAGSMRAQLEAALHGRVSLALGTWLGQHSPKAEIAMIDAREQPALFAREGAIEARLPFSWLIDVWAKGLATIWGRFCLQAISSDGQSFELTTIGPDLAEPAVISMRLAGGSASARGAASGHDVP